MSLHNDCACGGIANATYDFIEGRTFYKCQECGSEDLSDKSDTDIKEAAIISLILICVVPAVN